MTTDKLGLPDRHDDECRRRLPYNSPLWTSLDIDCPRCKGLITLLEQAKNRRIAASEELKRKIISKLDGLPHNARGFKQQELIELAGGPEAGKRIRLMKALRELIEDRLVQEYIVSGVQRYVLYGR
jgi:hypothetical protein